MKWFLRGCANVGAVSFESSVPNSRPSCDVIGKRERGGNKKAKDKVASCTRKKRFFLYTRVNFEEKGLCLLLKRARKKLLIVYTRMWNIFLGVLRARGGVYL